MNNAPQDLPDLKVVIGPLALLFVGIAMFVLASTQPAFVGSRIGPGLFAQTLSAGTIAMSLVWLAAAVSANLRKPSGGRADKRLPLLPGLALLAAVAAFIGLMPSVGLVGSAAAAAALAGIGAGDRTVRAVALTVTVAALLSLVIGLVFLPPTTRLFPWSPF